jgi:hypothetical protein
MLESKTEDNATRAQRDRGVTSVARVTARLAARECAAPIGLGHAVGHRSHILGLANPSSLLGERAFAVDAGSFLYLTCHCGRTPFEIADDLEVSRDLLGPLAAEQSLMISVQRALREDFHDPAARELLAARGATIGQALRWRPMDAGLPVECWGADLEPASESEAA